MSTESSLRGRSGVAGVPRRRSFVRILLAASAFAGANIALFHAQEPPPAQVEPLEAPAAEIPFFLKGVDLSLPAQEAFRGWPSEETVSGHLYWFPWGFSTFQKAALFGRPLLLVLHVPWNRLSQRLLSETLKDPEVIRAINGGFLLTLVDADRRPDIRERYQTGTWPVVAFLLPDGKPMISAANPAGTPAPITTGLVAPATMQFFLDQAVSYYARNAPSLEEQATKWVEAQSGRQGKAGPVAIEASNTLARWLVGSADRTDGGFGVGPRFLVPGLAEYAGTRAARGEGALEEPARFMLSKLVAGPIYDRRDGGMHRIAMSPNWQDVQYEKPLETNANLLRDLVYAVRREDSGEFREAMRGTARFLTSVLARPGGGFSLAQTADPRSADGGAYWRSGKEPLPPPPVYGLVLSGPNALAGAALLRAGALLADDAVEKAGRDALDLVLSKGYRSGRGVMHVIEPNPDDRRYLEDQAAVAFAFEDAFESTGEPKYLEASRDIVLFCTRNLLVPGETAMRDSLPDAQPLGTLGSPVRPPRENVLLARAMLRIHAQGAGEDLREQAVSILAGYAGDPVAYGLYGTGTALAIEEAVGSPMTIRIEGRPGDRATRALRRAAISTPFPWSVVTAGSAEAKKASATISFNGETRTAASPERLLQEVRTLTAGGLKETRP